MALTFSSRKWVYDVFPSFVGEDVRKNFLSHFLKELDRKLIFAFKDINIQSSKLVNPDYKQVIKDSKIAVVILSINYASSSWCLNELLEIVKCREECGQRVIPVFYGLDPSHVRNQTGEFGKIFEETCLNKTEEEVIQWRRALTDIANFSGFHSETWDNDAKMIEEITKDIFHILQKFSPPNIFETFVGIEDHFAEMQILLQLESEEVRIVGIWGPLGIGKTTIARSLFALLSPTFQNSIYIDRDFVSKSIESSSRANMDGYHMKLQLQSKFLSTLSGVDGVEVSHLGAVRERLQHRKLLILIDDLDDLWVLEALVHTQWYGNGSRIIVVTKDKHFLRDHGIDHIYTVGFPSENQALEMFCRSGFGQNYPPDGFRELASQVVLCAGSLPLALKVFGSILRGRDKEYWIHWIQKLQGGWGEVHIEKFLRISYDVLAENQKAIFRYIACLFIGEEVDNIKLFLDDSKLDVDSELMNLLEKSLVHVREGTIDMHRLLQEMGKKIVCEQSNKPGNREFLVDSNDIRDVFEGNTGAEKVIGIAWGVDDTSYMHESAFQGMNNLRFLKIFIKEKKEVRWDVPQEFNCFPTKLRLLSWENYPLQSMPPKFHPENLVKLQMQGSKLEKLWEGVHQLKRLKIMDLRGSEHLKEIPNLSMASNLQTLCLNHCSSLVELPSSIQYLNKLEELDISFCNKMEILPTGINLQSLDSLDFSGCSRLSTFPNISTNISDLSLSQTGIEEVPWWIQYFSRLCRLDMKECNSLRHVSLNMFKLKHLVKVDFSNCGALTESSWDDSPNAMAMATAMATDSIHSNKLLVSYEASSLRDNSFPMVDMNLTNCFKLDQKALYHQLKLNGCGIRLPKDSSDFLANVSEGDKSPEVILGGHETEHREEFGDSAVKISSSHNWSYDVFLSSSGEDVHVSLVSHFLTKLDQKLISVFKDNKMDISQPLDPNRKQAIRDSRIAVIVFSKYYATSSWCLDELLEILECKEKLGQTVISIFYSLDPSDIWKQLGEFGEAFEKTCKNRTAEEKIQWRRALTNAATISGYHLTSGNEAKMTEEIVNDVWSKLKITPSVEKTELTHNHGACGSIPEELTDVEGETDGVLWNAKSTVNTKKAESVQGEANLYERSRKDDTFPGEINSVATFNAQNSIENKRVEPFSEENKHGKVSKNSTMVMYDKHIPQHQVFINFWGEEIRFSFISHLVSALSTEGVNVFIERYEKRGEDGKTFRGIEDSNIALVVFSSRYTESRCCLDELVKIKERMDEGKLLIIPTFYEVEPSQVKQLEGSFGLKLWNLWRIHRDHHIVKWKEALQSVAAIKGFCSKEQSSESKFITSVVKKVNEVIRISLLEGENQSFLLSTENGKTTKMSRGKGEKHESFHNKSPLFGLEQRMRQLEKKLEFDCNETRIIGVVGMAGIGKTTLAIMLHEKWGCKFVRSAPLLGIHKKSGDYGLAWLRNTLLQVLLGGKFGAINDNPTHGSLKDKLLQTKVFVVLDDVSNKKQLKFLLSDLTWIKKGSKIVITSRDKSLIEPFVHETYVVPPLKYEEAFQLFSYHAFGDHVTSAKLCRELVDCAGGNPLVIKLLGKQLHGRYEAQWEMRRGDLIHFGLVILDIFRCHCDGLSKKQKDMFLDIASFFRSEDDNFVRSLLDPGDHDATDAENELRDLTRKGMIAITGCRVEMPDLLYMFGKIYSSQALIEENGGKSRLLYTPEIIDALINQKDTKSIRGICLDMFDVAEVMVLHRQTFTNMPNLRYLKIYDSYCPRPCKPVCKLDVSDGLEFPLEKVRYLHWEKFPLEELPPDFRPENLVDLRLSYSMIERIWEGVKETPRLKWVDLSHSSKLLNLLALSKAKNLERLNLEGCTNLDELPEEMQNMKSLVYLNMRGCIRLSSLPNMNLISLKTLILSDCSSFKEFQLISQSLVVLHLDGTAIKGLPQAIQQLERLVLLNLRNCKMLECIPNCLGKLKVLEELILSGCSRLKNLLDVRHNMKHLQILLLDEIGVDEMPKISCFTGSEGQASVDVSLQPSVSYPSEWPRGFDCVSSLRRLCLSGNDFVSLQNDIGQLYNLTWLDVKQCKKLKYVPTLPPRLEYFDAHGCDLLERVANPLALLVVEHAHAIFNFSNCNNLDQEAEDNIISYTRRRSQLMLGAQSRYNGDFASGALMRTCFPGWEVPKWFNYQSSGPVLERQLPPHWSDSRFTGIALCAVISSNGYQKQRNRLLVNCNCEFKRKDGSIIHFTCIVGGWSELSNTPKKVESSHVFIGFTSMLDISKHGRYDEEGCFCTISSLEFQVTDGTEKILGCEVLRCGFSFIYATDEREKICWDTKTVVIPERVENVPGGNSPLYEDPPTTSTDSKKLDISENTIEDISSLHNIYSGSFNKEKLQGVKTFNTDLLTEQHKDVFLDIACFFRSENEYFLRSLLDSGDPDSPDAVSEVRDLAKEFLITISDGRVETNDGLCKNLGSPRWLRLWKYKDILDKLMKKKNLKEANDVRGIFLDMSEVMQSIAMERMTFINMRSLRYLKIYESCCPRKGESDCKLRLPDGLDFPLKEVRYFHWMKFPLNELPPDFRPENMVDLRLPYSKVERLWKGVKDTPRLKWVDLSHSSKLLNLSGLAKALSLQRLNLEGCTNLNELPREMKNMKSLVYLNMRGCVRLISLPRMNLISLKTLILSDCSNLKEFQVISQSLEVLHLDGTIIKGLPLAIQKLKRLVLLNLKNCKMLECIPNCLGNLKLLEELVLSGCSRLKNLPDVRHSMKHVQTLLFDGTGAGEMPDISCFIESQGQTSVEMSFQHFGSYFCPSEWPRGVKRVSSLRRLCLSGHDFVSLHNDIGHLYNLTWLDIKQCTKLRSIPVLPPRLQYFTAHGCDSLERVANPLAIQMLTEQIHASFSFSNCNKLDQDATEAIISYTRWKSQMIVDALSRYNGGFTLEASVGTCIPGWEVPAWFSHRASGPALEAKLPPHWCASRFRGISLCAVILFPSHTNQRNRLLVKCNCVFKSEDGSLIHFSCTVGGWSEPGNMIGSPHVFLSYASILDVRELRKDNEEECIHTQGSFEFQVTDGTEELEGYEVIKSGISFVYASDDLQVNSSEHRTTVEINQDIASSSWVQDLFGYIFLAFSCLIVFAVLSLSVLVFAPKYYLSFSDFGWPLLARILFYVAFALFLKQDATREIPSQDR